MSPCCNSKLRNEFRQGVCPNGKDYDFNFCINCGRCEAFFNIYKSGDDLGEKMTCLDCMSTFNKLQNPFYDTACPTCLGTTICQI